MECITCKVEINPQWTHAIEINICPFCGKAILDEHLKNLFSTLRETMMALQAYPAQLNDWMLSNHNYIKTDSPHLSDYMPKETLRELRKIQDEKDFQEKKKFMVKVKTETGVEEVQAETLQSEEKTNDFFKRAEVIRTSNTAAPKSPNASPVFQSPAEKTNHFKEMAKQIKKAGSAGITSSGDSLVISPEMLEQADPEAVAEFQAMISGNEVTSSLPDTSEEEVPAHILAANIAVASKAKSGGTANAADLLKLQQMQDRIQSSKHNFESGANRGKGGFSRSD